MPGEPRILRDKMKAADIAQLSADTFGDMFKLVVDIDREVVAVGGMMHADAEELLLDDGSEQEYIWGANYFPAKPAGSRLEYTALINIRPSARNLEQYIESPEIRERVRNAVARWIGAE